MAHAREGDPCRGHPCDGCRTCRSGRCCRRDDANYQLPGLGEWDGPIYGELGMFTTDGDKAECHACGRWFGHLGGHVARAHDLTAAEYRAIFGLRAKTKLIGPSLRDKRRERLDQLERVRPARSSLLDLTPEQRSQVARTPRRLESRIDPKVRAAREQGGRNAARTRRERTAAGLWRPRVSPPEHMRMMRERAVARMTELGRFWTPESARKAIHGMLEALGVAQASPAEIAATVRKRHFIEHGLQGMLASVFHNRVLDALQAYDPAIAVEDRSQRPHDYWKGEAGRAHARATTRKLLEELGLEQATTDEIAAAQLTRRHFEHHGLAAMLNTVYGALAYNALVDLYPDLRPWQMRQAPSNYWSGPEGRIHAREAVAWLLDRLGLAGSPAEAIYVQATYDAFRAYHLTGVLSKVYGNCVGAALDDYLRPDT